MGHYDIQQVCENGHQITDSLRQSPEFGQRYCQDCGAATISKCPNCKRDIPGYYKVEGVWDLTGNRTAVPERCGSCGGSFPWTGKKATQAKNETPFGTAEDIVLHLFDRFHTVARKLRDRHDSRPTLDITDEYDVQDLLHSMLHIFFADVRSEEWTPSHAGASARMDFLLKEHELVVELKMWRKGLTPKIIGDELLADIGRYASHPHCKKLLCFVYDPTGQVAKARSLENDLSGDQGGLVVKVRVRPELLGVAS